MYGFLIVCFLPVLCPSWCCFLVQKHPCSVGEIDKPYRCMMCGLCFPNGQYLQAHVSNECPRAGEGPQDKPYACEYCRKPFTGTTTLMVSFIRNTLASVFLIGTWIYPHPLPNRRREAVSRFKCTDITMVYNLHLTETDSVIQQHVWERANYHGNPLQLQPLNTPPRQSKAFD